MCDFFHSKTNIFKAPNSNAKAARAMKLAFDRNLGKMDSVHWTRSPAN